MRSPIFVVTVCAIGLVVSGCNRRTFTMPGQAMEPTIRKDDKVMFDASAYKNQTPQRWEVVALHPLNTTDKEMTWALRVVGLPGEKISFSPEGDILVGGTAVPRPAPIASVKFVSGRATEPVAVPPDSYYVLGDSPMKAYDSRSWGALPRANILGKVIGK
jgi:signal peptidase I